MGTKLTRQESEKECQRKEALKFKVEKEKDLRNDKEIKK
jgi:hypothetical protein